MRTDRSVLGPRVRTVCSLVVRPCGQARPARECRSEKEPGGDAVSR